MFKSLSTSMIVRGVLAIAVGIIALAWPQVTILALVIVFAVYAFIAVGLQAMRAFSSRTAAPAPTRWPAGCSPSRWAHDRGISARFSASA